MVHLGRSGKHVTGHAQEKGSGGSWAVVRIHLSGTIRLVWLTRDTKATKSPEVQTFASLFGGSVHHSQNTTQCPDLLVTIPSVPELVQLGNHRAHSLRSLVKGLCCQPRTGTIYLWVVGP